ncbi:MAG: hypothetical protein HC853_02940 [Anaerolineae bacterium]|nr:hypothetical protein [Anaerolineae bacterium]
MFIHFTNRGLVDSPPTEFRLYANEGTEFVPSSDFRYLVGTLNDAVPAGNPNTTRQVATFIVPSIRPGVDDYMLVNVKTAIVGNVTLQLESLTSPVYTSVFTEAKDLSLRLTGSTNIATDTKLDTSFTLQNGAFNGGGSITLDRLGPTDYFTPTVQVTNDNGNLTFIVSAAVPHRAITRNIQKAQGALPTNTGTEDASDLERVQQVIKMTQQTLDRLYGMSTFNEPDRIHLQRLLQLNCMLKSSQFDANNLDDKAAADLLKQIGDIEAITLLLGQTRRQGVYSVDMSISMARMDQLLHGLFEATLKSDFYDRKSNGEGEQDSSGACCAKLAPSASRTCRVYAICSRPALTPTTRTTRPARKAPARATACCPATR